MSRLQIHRPNTSDKTPFKPATRPFAPSAGRRNVQDAAAAPEVAPQHTALRSYNALQPKLGTTGAIQANFTLGPVGDRADPEADSVTRQVMQQTAVPGSTGMAPDTKAALGPSVQRQPELDEEDLLRKPLPGAVQPQPQAQPAFQVQTKRGSVEMSPLPRAPFLQPSAAEFSLQTKGDGSGSREGASAVQRPNKTGLPDNLKAGVESLSGMSLDHVKVHYNSARPAQLNALAYAQGSDIHVAPGQEQHLPHEAWHIVQQAQGRVRPTMQMKDGVPVNDDAGLEREADVMGAKAPAPAAQLAGGPEEDELLQGKLAPEAVAQRELVDAVIHSPRLIAQQASIRAVLSSPRVIAQAKRLDGLFGAAQLCADSANASYRVMDSSPRVQQLERHQGMADGERKADKNTQLRQSPASSGNIVQCYGQIRFANLDNAQKYQTKGAAIIAALQATPNIQNFLANKNAVITLESDPQLASVRVRDDQVQITLSPWFFEQESRGRILGMLVHEFGVHPLADEALTVPEQTQEALDITNNTAFPTGIPGHPGHTITPGAAGQTDHVFAAVAGQPRFISYQQTAYQMANAMYLRSLAPGADVTGAHVTDQIMTYLSDIAMILATNDHRGQIVAEPQRTADAFNHVRGGWLTFVGGQPNGVALAGLTPGTKTKGDVLGEVAGMAGKFILSIGTGSKDNTKIEQTKTGVFNPTYSDLTNAQVGVLADHTLNLQPKNLGAPSPSFLDALDDVTGSGAGTNRLQARADIFAHRPDPNPAIDADLGSLYQKLSNNTLESPISSDNLYYLAVFLNLKIRIVKANGQMEVKGNGQRCTLLEVAKPALHYRFAT